MKKKSFMTLPPPGPSSQEKDCYFFGGKERGGASLRTGRNIYKEKLISLTSREGKKKKVTKSGCRGRREK